jgi:hypothetical protein
LVLFPFDGFAVEEDGGTTVDLIESSDMVLQSRQKKKIGSRRGKTEKGETGKKKSASTMMRNYRLSQKLKLLGYGEFNHLTNILTLSLTCGLRLPLNEWGPTCEIFNFLNER